jgi:hypothetical protein
VTTVVSIQEADVTSRRLVLCRSHSAQFSSAPWRWHRGRRRSGPLTQISGSTPFGDCTADDVDDLALYASSREEVGICIYRYFN